MVATEVLKLAMETEEERKARLKKMVATTQLMLAPETEDERRARLEYLSDNPSIYSGTSLIRSSKMRTPPSTGHHQESSCVCFCQINLGGAYGLVARARMAIIILYSVLP